MKILVVDDNKANRYLLDQLLRASGYEVVLACNGVEALAELRAGGIDLVVSDVLMPEMDGFHLCHEIRSSAEFRELPIVIYTATYTDEKDEESALAMGASIYLRKPSDPSEILARIAELVDRKHKFRPDHSDLKSIEPETFLREYNERLINKLEHRMLTLQAANDRLAASENHLRAILDAEPECVKLVGRDCELLDMNPAGLRMIEADDLASVKEKSILGMIVPDQRAAMQELCRNIFAGGNGTLEFGIVGLKGRHLQMATNAVPLRNERGEVVAALCVTRDVTRERDSEQKLREALEFNWQVLTSAREGILVLDKDLRYVMWNPFFEQMAGIRAEEAIGKHPWEVFPAIEGTDAEAKLRRALEGETIFDFERLVNYSELGEPIWSSASMTPLREGKGSIRGVLVIVRNITEAKKNAAERDRLASIVEGASDLVGIAEPNGAVLFINRAMREALGIPLDENVAGSSIVDYHDPETTKTITTQSIETAVSLGEWRGESSFLARDGRRIPVSQVVISHRDSNDVVDYLFTISRDITAIKESERALRESNDRFSLIARATNDGVWDWEIGHDRVWWNDALYSMMGCDLETTIPSYQVWVSKIHPDDRKQVLEGLRDVLDGDGDSWVDEFRFEMADGSHGYVLDRGYIMRDANGKAVRMIGAMMDITARKRSEIALGESEARYRDVFENANDLIYTHDLDGNITSFNRSGEIVSGYSRAEALNLNIRDFLAPEYLDIAQEMITRKLSSTEPTIYDIEVVTKSGRRTLLEVNTRLIIREGVPVGVQGIGRDITERRQMEKELRSIEHQLNESQKMESIGRLAGGIAHDFNNLLLVITGYSELAIRGLSEGDPQRDRIEEIRKAGMRAASLTRQLLAFSRKQVLEPRVLNLNDSVVEMEKLLRRLIGEDIDLVLVLDPEMENVRVDPGQFEQVLMNLVVNARDAMPQGGRLSIETSTVDIQESYTEYQRVVAPGRYARIAVTDTGAGMDLDTQEKIFEPFFTTKEVGKGTGLGLSTVFGIVKQSDGYIKVTSDVGKGTVFEIFLPIVFERVQQILVGKREPVTEGNCNETILLVEDEAQVRRVASIQLQTQGYHVIEAANGNEALQVALLHKGPIDLLLTDVVMPQMSGRELAERIVEIRKGIRVVYMSGYTDDAIVHHGSLKEGVILIQKPFTSIALFSRIREVLDGVA